MRTGGSVSLIDISSRGALLESSRRLTPGSYVELLLSFPLGIVVVRGLILRCEVTRLAADRIWYRGSVKFNSRVSWCDPDEYPIPSADSLDAPRACDRYTRRAAR